MQPWREINHLRHDDNRVDNAFEWLVSLISDERFDDRRADLVIVVTIRRDDNAAKYKDFMRTSTLIFAGGKIVAALRRVHFRAMHFHIRDTVSPIGGCNFFSLTFREILVKRDAPARTVLLFYRFFRFIFFFQVPIHLDISILITM